jgi:poly-gamma-glutamate capsule biosynthesis protein CapA/YwtB (metallophosphatase superfamily)
MPNQTLIYGVGDIAPYRQEPHTIFGQVRDFLHQGDLIFGQLETNISERGTRLPQARHTARVNVDTAQAIKDAGFNIISFAGNHCMDWGREAFFDTIDSLKARDIAVIGVGENIQAARKPAFFDNNGNRIAFLAYNTILPQCYWAEKDRPGCAPLRGLTFYEQIEHDQPGTPCRIHTFPHKADLEAMLADIREAKKQADVVIVSQHWGIHFVPATLADYQPIAAYAAIDAGADLILGHHAHILKGVEVYKGKAIFYSMCNFAIDIPFPPGHENSPGFKEIQTLNPAWKFDPEYPTYVMPPDSRKSLIVKCVVADKAIRKVSFIPVMINKQSQPVIQKADDPGFGEVISYLTEVSAHQKLNVRFVPEGDEVAVEV